MWAILKPMDKDTLDNQLERYKNTDDLTMYYRLLISRNILDLQTIDKIILDREFYGKKLGNLMIAYSFMYINSGYIEKLEEMGYVHDTPPIQELANHLNHIKEHDCEKLRKFIFWMRDRYNIINYNPSGYMRNSTVLKFILDNFSVDIETFKLKVNQEINYLYNVLELC